MTLDLSELKRLEAAANNPQLPPSFAELYTREENEFRQALRNHAPALIAAAERCEELEAQLRKQTKSFCTHCGKLFPKGSEGLAQFRAHIAECNTHPLHPLAKRVAELEAIISDAAAPVCSLTCPSVWQSNAAQPHSDLCRRIMDAIKKGGA